MTLQQRVERAGQWLRGAVILASVLRAATAVLAVFVAVALTDLVVALPIGVRRAVPWLALIPAALVLWRAWREVRTGAAATSVALWIEARFPALRYALVTAVDPRYAGQVPELDRAAAAVPFDGEARRAAQRALIRPLIAAVVVVAILLFLPSGAVARVARPKAGDSLDRATLATRGNPLATIVVRVAPPEYSGIHSESIDDPASVRALVGGTLRIEGRVAGAEVTASVGEKNESAVTTGTRWHLALAMPTSATAVRLRSGANERLLVLEPVVDSAPIVTLTLPVRDSILRRPTGRISIAADASDDLGLASANFEFIVSSGGGETFTFKSGTISGGLVNGNSAALVGVLNIDSLKLNPGDIIHLRAVARDRNNVTGPGMGASETRTLRIARADEYDSVAVDAAPPPEPEKNALSQRMLLMTAQALQKKRPKISQGQLVSESRSIALDQTRLRKRVGQIVFQRLGEGDGEEGDALDKRLDKLANADSLLAAAERASGITAGANLEGNEEETPILQLNRTLLEAYNFMWSATTELEIGEPGRAIPWMQKALDALQSARAAERIYLRGKTRTVIVDVDRVRMQGKDKGVPDARKAREPADPARAARLARFDAALALLKSAPSAAVDSLLLLRLDLLDRDAPAARALESAANAVRGGKRNGTEALIRARRALAGGVTRSVSVSTWGTPE